MNSKIPSLGLVSAALGVTLASQSCLADALALGYTRDKVEPAVKMEVSSFPLEEVRLLDGPFRRAMELDGAYLLSLDTERLVRNFRVNAGLPTTAKPLGGWEEPAGELRGHFVGHYMSACAQMCASTGDVRYKEKGEAVVQALGQCQEKLNGGYLSAFPETFIDRVEQRKQVWAPYYTLHKILAGLEDMYVYCQDDQALGIAHRFGDWVVARNGRLSDEQMQAMLQTEQGGMNEGMANLYSLTGEKKYLEMSLRFNHRRVVDPLEAGHDDLTGLHANTQIPKIIGLARQYELTGETNLKAGAEEFWEAVVHHRSYVIGGNSDGEMFTATNRLSQMGTQHDGNVQHLQHAQADAAFVLLGTQGGVRGLLRAGVVQPHIGVAESRDRDDVLLRAAANRLAEKFQQPGRGLLVLHWNGSRESWQVWGQHLFSRRQPALCQ